eukprot:CCRYP_002394-RA/>CCRYP_002394-RA protein AED:0.84 eAED:0.44 QI:0/0/0/0.33/1/1/3/0/456
MQGSTGLLEPTANWTERRHGNRKDGQDKGRPRRHDGHDQSTGSRTPKESLPKVICQACYVPGHKATMCWALARALLAADFIHTSVDKEVLKRVVQNYKTVSPSRESRANKLCQDTMWSYCMDHHTTPEHICQQFNWTVWLTLGMTRMSVVMMTPVTGTRSQQATRNILMSRRLHPLHPRSNHPIPYEVYITSATRLRQRWKRIRQSKQERRQAQQRDLDIMQCIIEQNQRIEQPYDLMTDFPDPDSNSVASNVDSLFDISSPTQGHNTDSYTSSDSSISTTPEKSAPTCTHCGDFPIPMLDGSVFYTPMYYNPQASDCILSPHAMCHSSRGYLSKWVQEGHLYPPSGRVTFYNKQGDAVIRLDLEQRNGLYYTTTTATAIDHPLEVEHPSGNRAMYLHTEEGIGWEEDEEAPLDWDIPLQQAFANINIDAPTTNPRCQQLEADLWQARLAIVENGN